MVALPHERHFRLPDVFNMQAPPGPHIHLEENGFKVLVGEGLIDEGSMAALERDVGERLGLPPAALEANDTILANWVEGLIEDAYYPRAALLVETLGMYEPEAGFLATSKIVDKVRKTEQMVLPDNDDDITVLDLFNGDQKACRFSLLAGLLALRVKFMRRAGQNPEFQEICFRKAGEILGVDASDYNHTVLTVNDSPLFFEWLAPNGGPMSLTQSVEALLYDYNTRVELDQFLTDSAPLLLNAAAQTVLMENNLLLSGNIAVREDRDIVVTDEQVTALVQELQADPIKNLYFVTYLMSYDSHRGLMQYLYWRFGKLTPGRQDVPVEEVHGEEYVETEEDRAGHELMRRIAEQLLGQADQAESEGAEEDDGFTE